MIDKLKFIDEAGYKYYFQFTLNAYDNKIEKNLRDKPDIIKTFAELSGRIGRERVFWRYDPIILNDSINIDFHIKSFESLCSRLYKYTNSCTISFVDNYTKLKGIYKSGALRNISVDEINGLCGTISDIAKKYNLKVKTCCEEIDLSSFGILHGSCIDKNVIENICGYEIKCRPDKNQRKNCGCIESIDIGEYNTCSHGCIYCYANYNEKTVAEKIKKHDIMSDILIGHADDKNINKNIINEKDQTKLF
jgi:hypothetical protein